MTHAQVLLVPYRSIEDPVDDVVPVQRVSGMEQRLHSPLQPTGATSSRYANGKTSREKRDESVIDQVILQQWLFLPCCANKWLHDCIL